MPASRRGERTFSSRMARIPGRSSSLSEAVGAVYYQGVSLCPGGRDESAEHALFAVVAALRGLEAISRQLS